MEIIRAKPQSVRSVLGNYYKALGRYCHNLGSASPLLDIVQRAVSAPLVTPNAPGMSLIPFCHLRRKANCGVDTFTEAAYHEFAVSFLTQPDIFLFEANPDTFGANVDVDRLSEWLHAGLVAEPGLPRCQTDLMWLLAHFIVLQKIRKQTVLHSRSLKVLYSLLSALSSQIRFGFAPSDLKSSADIDNEEGECHQILPLYVSEKLASLTDRDEISSLLKQFTS